MFQRSRQHLAQAGESYFEHLRFALLVAMLAIGAGLACLVHAFIPGLCQKTCSRTIARLQLLFAERERLQEVQADRKGVLTFVGLLALWLGMSIGLLTVAGPTFISFAFSALSLVIAGAYLATNRELEALEEKGE